MFGRRQGLARKGQEGMDKSCVLRLNREFRAVYSRGGTQVAPQLVTYMRKNRLHRNRVGITASKKIGNAVQRNRARRVIREAYRQIEGELPAGWDIVFVARSRTARIKMGEVLGVMRRQTMALTEKKKR